MKIPQHIPTERRFTINDFNGQFPNDDACLDWLMEQRHAGNVAMCDYCKVERKHHRIASKKAYACDYCGTYISPMAGTIFEKSSTSLRLWFYAMYLMSATRCGISAKQIQRECGVTYKTAWRMFRQIRTLMSEDFKMGGPGVEMAETYVGGADKNKHVGKRREALVVPLELRRLSSAWWSVKAAWLHTLHLMRRLRRCCRLLRSACCLSRWSTPTTSRSMTASAAWDTRTIVSSTRSGCM